MPASEQEDLSHLLSDETNASLYLNCLAVPFPGKKQCTNQYTDKAADEVSVADQGFPVGGGGGAPTSDAGAFRRKRKN